MLVDCNGKSWCAWCGETMPDHRLGHETCGGICEAELAADRAKAVDDWLARIRREREIADKAAKQRSYQRKKERRNTARKHGLCVRCSQPNPTPERSHCPPCSAAARASVQRWRENARETLRREAADRREHEHGRH